MLWEGSPGRSAGGVVVTGTPNLPFGSFAQVSCQGPLPLHPPQDCMNNHREVHLAPACSEKLLLADCPELSRPLLTPAVAGSHIWAVPEQPQPARAKCC